MTVQNSREAFMQLALREAERAALEGEVPVGAVIVQDGRIIAAGRNCREQDQSALAHAEIGVIQAACEEVGSWRLSGTTLYVTLEPCPMCMGAIINARIPEIVFGAWDPKAGCCGSVVDFTAMPFNHHPRVISGVLEEECAAVLQNFFRKLRRVPDEDRK